MPTRSLRVRLTLLMLVSAIPAFAVIGGIAWWMREHESERRQEELLTLAKALADKHQENLDAARLLLVNLARLPEVRAGRGAACQETIANIRALAPPHVANLFVVQADGNVLCSAQSPDRQFKVTDMAWFRGALATRGFRVGEYHISRRTGTPALVLTHTLGQGEGGVVVAAALDLSWLAAQPYLTGQPATTAYAIYDRAGTLLLRQPGRGSTGHNIAGHPHWHTLTALREAAVFRGPGGDNVERLFAYAPLGPAAQPYARLVVGVSPATLYAPARELFLLGLAGLAAAMALGMLAGWIGSGALVTRPLRPVLDAVRRMADGDLTARTPHVPPRDNEISRLAVEVDRMAEALSRRDQALTEALERAQAYLDVVGVMVLVLNAKGNIAVANPKTCEVLGCGELHACVGGNWFDTWIPEEEREQAKALFARNMAGPSPPEECHEGNVLTAEGERRLIAWHIAVLRDQAGTAIGVLCAGEDITEARRIQEALKLSEERLRLAQEAADVGTWEWDVATGRVTWSPQCERLYGVAPDSIRHYEDWRRLVQPEDFARIEAQWQDPIGRDEPFEVEFRIRRGPGEIRWLVTRGRAIRDAEGRVARLVGINLDITERKHLLEEQQRLQLQLQQAQKMEALGQLTGGIAHDFNNILAAILGFAKLALRLPTTDQDSELAAYLREVVGAGERARDLVARMLTFVRAQPGRPARPLAAAPLVKEAVKMLAATIPASIRIETRIEAQVPEVAIEPVDLHQILINLVINARDALDGKGRIVIGLSPPREGNGSCDACHKPFSGDFLELTVSDDGPGIAPDVLPRLFEPFFTTKEGGSGMGLAMVNGLLHRAGGHCMVRSDTGQGSVFHIFLPVAAPAPAPDPRPLDAAAPMPAVVRHGHALIVDDEAAILRLLRAGLEMEGWRVSAFDSPRQALAVFRDNPDEFDVVVSDQAMPGMTGLELIHALRALRPTLPVILCTGFVDGLDEDTLRAQGILGPCRKPLDIEELLATLSGAMANANVSQSGDHHDL